MTNSRDRLQLRVSAHDPVVEPVLTPLVNLGIGDSIVAVVRQTWVSVRKQEPTGTETLPNLIGGYRRALTSGEQGKSEFVRGLARVQWSGEPSFHPSTDLADEAFGSFQS